MVTEIEGIYKNGVIKPLKELKLENNTKVIIKVLEKMKSRTKLMKLAGIWKKDTKTYNIFKGVYNERKKFGLRI